ncbi:MAG TPA: carbohydrate ABC transporter permease [Candidatus Alectryocaccomicrobium excrementavium]|uniref:Carbohydrate ABC transporter permease n=1 Tax=Candidatus Alectryocaccomicrobium excrementavium TaxID=2840668 RepID=A0A9D1G2P9_9FIRM|nr:carbohydrate ABC transporter permease [Candidatus Alectryocaccomicrobium excrementavium]
MQIRRRYSRSRLTLMDAVVGTILTLMALLVILPFYNAIMISFVTESEYFRNPFILFPHEPTLEAYTTLLDTGNILAGYGNTLIHIAIGLPISMFITFALGYVLSRPAFPGRRFLYVFVLITMLFSGGMVPSFLLIRSLDLMNTRWSVILSCLLSTYYVVLVTNFIRSLPGSLLESARLDGASEATILVRIVLPLSKPILATIALFYAVDKWNEWWNSMLYINRMEMYPLQLILQNIINTYQSATDRNIASADALNRLKTFSMGIKMAAIVVTMLPIMCVFPFLQRFFVKGIMIGAVKG